MKKISIITKETIKEHIATIEKSKKSGSFKGSSNDVFSMIHTENPEFSTQVVKSMLESNKPEEFKKGYLAGVATLYDLLRKQIEKDSA